MTVPFPMATGSLSPSDFLNSKVYHCRAILSEDEFHGLLEQKKTHKAVAMVITLTQGLAFTTLQAQGTWERT
jgi:hypothetical protein